MKQYTIKEQAEEHFETGNSNENYEPMSGTPVQFQTQKTLAKKVTRKMSSKGRCRVLTVAQSLVDDTIDSPNIKGDNLQGKLKDHIFEIKKPQGMKGPG